MSVSMTFSENAYLLIAPSKQEIEFNPQQFPSETETKTKFKKVTAAMYQLTLTKHYSANCLTCFLFLLFR